MTEFDLDRLGDVWRQEPDPAELDAIKHAAENVRRRARWAQAVDALAAIVVSGVVLFLVVSNPAVDTLLVGGAAILLLLVSQLRSRRLRQEELRSLTGTTEQMLDQSIIRVRATLKRLRSTMILTPVGIVSGLLVAFVVDRRSGGALSHGIAIQPGLGMALQVAGIVVVALAIVHMARLIRANRRELERLIDLRQSYRDERESTSE